MSSETLAGVGVDMVEQAAMRKMILRPETWTKPMSGLYSLPRVGLRGKRLIVLTGRFGDSASGLQDQPEIEKQRRAGQVFATERYLIGENQFDVGFVGIGVLPQQLRFMPIFQRSQV